MDLVKRILNGFIRVLGLQESLSPCLHGVRLVSATFVVDYQQRRFSVQRSSMRLCSGDFLQDLTVYIVPQTDVRDINQNITAQICCPFDEKSELINEWAERENKNITCKVKVASAWRPLSTRGGKKIKF